VQYRVLGRLEVSDRERAIPLGGPKQRLVLANLLIRADQVVPTDRLIDEIWGEEPPEAARISLRSYLSHLRKALGPGRIEGRPPGYVLHVQGDEVDAFRFQALVQRGHRSLGENPKAAQQVLEEALALWRGPPFADLGDEPSLLTEVARLEEMHLTATEHRMEARLALGRHGELVAELETLTAQYPLRERMWGHLMVALYRSGRQAEALGAFRRARTMLSDELGIDPSPSLQRLHQQVLRQDPALEFRGEPLRGYQLVERIGEGAFGVVYRAYQPQVGREVAIKVIRPALANHPEFVRRFEAEAQLVARLEHPHIVPLYDYWRDADAAYLVMRLASGGNVRDKLASGPLDPDRAVGVLDQVASALATAHRRGVVHRDVKPANILLDEEGNAYLSDFGIALDVGDGSSPVSPVTSDVVAYRSPEQIRGERATPRSDLYALGVVLFEALAGRHPFPERSPQALIERHLSEALPSIRNFRPDLPPALDEVVAKATAKDPADRFTDSMALASALREALGSRVAVVPAPGVESISRNPYKGLRPFHEADAPDFFGREALVQRLVARLSPSVDGCRFLAVVGPSGSGKSSVVRAGLVPALRDGALPGSESWFFVEMMPGADPLEELEAALLRIAVNPPPGLAQELKQDQRGFLRAVERLLPPDGSELFLVIDQFEELFTLVGDEARRAHFLASLVSATGDAHSRVRVLITLRADFYDRPLAYQGFGALLGARAETVAPLSPPELERAVAGPVELIGATVESGLMAEVISEFADQPGALPLLQYALTEAFERSADHEVTLEAYRAAGGLSGALARRAEQILRGLDASGRESVRQLFLRLVVVGEVSIETRRRVPRAELASVEVDGRGIDAVADVFGSSRLLSFDRDPLTRGPTVEVAHEALLRSWGRLAGWIDAARDDLRTHRRLAAEVGEWDDRGRDPSFLLRGSRLEQLETWAAGADIALAAVEREYLEASLRQRESDRRAEDAQRQREASLRSRSVRRLRALVAVMAVGGLVAATLSVVAQDRGRRAQREARIATARELAAAAVSNLDVDSERSLLLALEAVETTYTADRTALPEAEEALHRALQAHRLVRTVPGYAGGFSADGNRLLVAGLEPGRADVYDAATGERISTAIGGGSVSQLGADHKLDLAFSSDGRLFATASDVSYTPDVRVFETATGEQVWRLSVPEGALYDPQFSPDGRFLATGGPPGAEGPRTYLFDLRTGELLSIFNSIGPIAFSPDGQRQLIADSWYDSERKAWVAGYVLDVQERGPTRRHEAHVNVYEGEEGLERLRGLTLLGQEGDVNGAAWSPDGGRLATSSPGQVIVWGDSTSEPNSTGKPLFAFFPPAGRFTTVAFGPDSRIATGMSDGTTIVWKLSADGAEPILTLAGHDAEVRGVDFSPDGTRLVTSSDDGKVKVWDITPGGSREWLTVEGSGGVGYSPDGSRLATGSEGGNVYVYDAASGRKLLDLRGHEGRVNAVVFDSDGARLASAGFQDGTARIWDAMSGVEQARIDPTSPDLTDTHQVFDVAFSPDGGVLATAGWGGQSSTLMWDPETGRLLDTLAEDTTEGPQWGRSVAFTPDGRLVAGEDFDLALVWTVKDGRILARIREQRVNALAFSPDGRRLVTGSLKGGVKIWDTRTGRQLDSLTGNLGQVWDLAFSPDGTRLATSSSDGTVRLWDARTGAQILTLARGVAEEVGAETKLAFPTDRSATVGVGGKLAFSPDGTQLAYTAADGTVRVLALDIDDLIHLARSRLTRSWTRDECRTYLDLDRCPSRLG
jgi:WD40 repeat protein/serine/threonine protein kinase